ncbi:hypothetical protein PBAL39_00245 [Pedobacter sp. BAL39]|uniref:hypothetical protein n=1 Tax=Pedobacter sp. BAL39 TaxID=391596 RepID=UPI0001559F91|nr:hypothetical protein [Pedobacter sp. BAL39]EDM34915.1 hypothetical protein PBAL39_00245 [Pedobacter sp. BAL39]
MKKLLIIAMACYGLSATAQLQESKNFLYLYSDSVIYADRIRMRMDLSDRLQVRADSRRVPLGQVKFINNQDGFFANTRKLGSSRYDGLAEKVIEGRMNLFQDISFGELYRDQFWPEAEFRRRSGYRSTYSSAQSITGTMYYNKGYGDLKKVKYINLKNDMSDDKESLDLLEGYRKSMRTTKVLYVAAGVSLLASTVAFFVDVNKVNEPTGPFGFREPRGGNMTGAFALMGVGAGFAFGGVLKHLSTARKLEAAIDHYNR